MIYGCSPTSRNHVIHILELGFIFSTTHTSSYFQAEIEKVKKRREERAIEKAQHEEEMVCLACRRVVLSCIMMK